VLPPDVNESFSDFTVVKDQNKIRFGLVTIKNLGTEIAKAIVEERKANGHFSNIATFLERIKHKNLNRKSLEALIKAGALDSLGEERGKLLANLDSLVIYHQSSLHDGGDQVSFFSIMEDKSSVPQLKLKDAPPASQAERLAWEKDLLGLYVSGHPLDAFGDKFKNNPNTIAKAKSAQESAPVVVAGIIEEVKLINTKKGDQMAFMRLGDYTGSIECVVFSRLFLQSRSMLVADKCVALKGKLSMRNGEASIVVETIKALS
jgi:DNA polymerase-3 subunit alpha